MNPCVLPIAPVVKPAQTPKKQPLGPIQQQWLEKLISGRYRQICGYLSDSQGGFCAIGVIVYTLGLSEGYPEIRFKSNAAKHIAYMNDSGWSFERITEEILHDPSRFFEEPA